MTCVFFYKKYVTYVIFKKKLATCASFAINPPVSLSCKLKIGEKMKS